nr:ROK family protein [Arthrobacter sp. Soil736]
MIGIDIGGTGIKGGITDLTTGRLEGDGVHIATPSLRTPHAVADVVAEVVRELEQRVEAQSVGAPVGVTYPGIVQHGVARSAANLDPSWVGFDIQALFTDRLHRTVEVINDADADLRTVAELPAGGWRGRQPVRGRSGRQRRRILRRLAGRPRDRGARHGRHRRRLTSARRPDANKSTTRNTSQSPGF